LGSYWQGAIKIVNDLVASDGTNFFFGGGSAANLVNGGAPNGVLGPTGTGWNAEGIAPVDIEIRRVYTFKPLIWMSAHGTSTGNPHAGVKNLGEFKSCLRCILEGELAENNWTGQYDQFGNKHLFSPKNQGSVVVPGTRLVTMSKLNNGVGGCAVVGGCVFAYCQNCTANGGAAGVGQFSCANDASQNNPTTCPAVGAFTGGPGAYIKVCPPGQPHGACILSINNVAYHVKTYNPSSPSPSLPATDIVELWSDEIATGFAGNSGTLPFVTTPITYTLCNRGLNPFAQVKNIVDRYGIGRHIMAGYQVQTAPSSFCNDEAQGVHNVTIHDQKLYDVDGKAWFNGNSANGCCNEVWGVRLQSNSTVNSGPTIPSGITVIHNDFALNNWQSNFSGSIIIFDNQYDATTAVSNADYMPNIVIRDNIGSSVFGITAGHGTGRFICGTLGGCTNGPVSQGVAIYGSPTHNGAGSTWDVRRNLTLQNIVPIAYNDLPDMNKGSNSIEACGCTAPNCTLSGGVPTWTTPVSTGQTDACDRITTVAKYGDIWNSYDISYPYQPDELQAGTVDLSFPVGSPYIAMASDGSNLGADLATVAGKTAGIYAPPNLLSLNLITSLGTITHGAAITPLALCAGQSTTSPYEGCGASPFKIWTITAGTVPAGLALDLNTGILSGTATSAGAYSVTISTTDAARQTAIRTFSGTIL